MSPPRRMRIVWFILLFLGLCPLFLGLCPHKPIPWFVSSQTKRVNNENHSPLYLLRKDDERFQSRVKNPRQPLWLFKTWASGG
jgi:hypothetical protein